MNINNNQNYTPTFKALHIAKCGDLNLYKVTNRNDMNFLNLLPQEIHTAKLMQNLTTDEYSRWDEMITYAIQQANTQGNVTYIETLGNKICGIATYAPGKTTNLDCICTWPVEFGQKVKLAGKTLFYQIFKDFLNQKNNRMTLDAITNGPYNTINKYKALGFKETSNVHPTKTEMVINSHQIKEKTKELSEMIPYEKGTGENINLFTEIEFP